MAAPHRDNAHPGPRTLFGGYFFGIPVGDLGWFASLLMGLASGFAAFFFATFVGIVALLIRNGSGHPTDYAISYKFIGLPFGILITILALAYLGTLWVKRVMRSN